MNEFTNAAPRPRLSEPIVRAARQNRRRRRLYFRLHNLGHAVASRIIGIWTGLLKALHDSRSQLAARVIDQHRHLLGDCLWEIERGKPKLRGNDIMSWRLYFLLAVLMIVFAFAHVLALQKLNAMQSERPPAAIDFMTD
jgi:predicted anti-sigma-YlaC factor YlaD